MVRITLGILMVTLLTGCGVSNVNPGASTGVISTVTSNSVEEHIEYIKDHKEKVNGALNRFDGAINHENPELTRGVESALSELENLALEYIKYENNFNELEEVDEKYKTALLRIHSFSNESRLALESGFYKDNSIGLSSLLEHMSLEVEVAELVKEL